MKITSHNISAFRLLWALPGIDLWVALVLFTVCFLLPSSLFTNGILSYVKPTYVLALCFLILRFWLSKNTLSLSGRNICLIASWLFLSTLAGFVNSDPLIALLPLVITLGFLIVKGLTYHDVKTFLSLSTTIFLIFAVGSIIAFILALVGFSPCAEFPNHDGRLNYYYYTSLTNTVFGNFIRPSAIFDEPGTYSFFICSLVAFRAMFRMREDKSIMLLLGGLITFSLAHVVFLIFYSVAFHRRFSVVVITLLLTILPLAGTLSDQSSPFWAFFLSRLGPGSDGTLISGDTRSLNLYQAYTYIDGFDLKSFLFSSGSSCFFRASGCKLVGHGATFLSPLVDYGLFVSLPYYYFLASPVWTLFHSRRLGVLQLLVVLLFLQRPYIHDVGYSFVALLSMGMPRLLRWRDS